MKIYHLLSTRDVWVISDLFILIWRCLALGSGVRAAGFEDSELVKTFSGGRGDAKVKGIGFQVALLLLDTWFPASAGLGLGFIFGPALGGLGLKFGNVTTPGWIAAAF